MSFLQGKNQNRGSGSVRVQTKSEILVVFYTFPYSWLCSITQYYSYCFVLAVFSYSLLLLTVF